MKQWNEEMGNGSSGMERARGGSRKREREREREREGKKGNE